jgi:hypothetical protein
MTKIDFKKELEPLYSASAKHPRFVEVAPLNYLMVDGSGNPNTSIAYADAVEALFSLAYTIKFAIRNESRQVDYGVMPLEGLWWMDDMRQFSLARKDEWKWTMMIMQPGLVTGKRVEECSESLASRKALRALERVRFDSFHEGNVAQILHTGPFAEEGPTIEKLHAFIEANGYALAGKHHEIYLSDIRRAAPAKWKTIIRQPIRAAAGHPSPDRQDVPR